MRRSSMPRRTPPIELSFGGVTWVLEASALPDPDAIRHALTVAPQSPRDVARISETLQLLEQARPTSAKSGLEDDEANLEAHWLRALAELGEQLAVRSREFISATAAHQYLSRKEE